MNKAANIDKFHGRYRYRFAINNIRITVYGKTVAECRQKGADKLKEIEAGLYKSGGNLSIDEYFERWLDARRNSVTGSTLRSNKLRYKSMSNKPIDAAGTLFGSLKLSKIETQNVRDLQTALSKENGTRTVNDTINLLKSIFKTAIEERIITWNPAAAVKPLKRTEALARDGIHRALTKKETTAFLRAAEERQSSYYNLYIFLLNTGLRIGEAGALTAFDITSKGINVQRTITRNEIGGYEPGKAAKTAAGRRLVPISEEARKALCRQQDLNRVLYNDSCSDNHVFKSPRGHLLNPSPINEDIAKICKKAGIERFTVHAFRDTFSTRCVESGMEVKNLQEIMGHTDISLTLGLYAHGNDERKTEQIKAVNFI